MGDKGGVLRMGFLQGLESLLFGVESTIYHLQRSLMQRLQGNTRKMLPRIATG
jgi:hypothetical protein